MAKDLSKISYDGLTDETVASVQKMFDKYDLDKDCRLSRPEFQKVLVACGLRDADARSIYGKVDSNNDGSVDMKEFVKWLYNPSPEMDTDKRDEANERMAKVHRHMKRGTMTQQEAMDDFFEFMCEMKEEYKFATKRAVVVLEKDLMETTNKKGERTGQLEKSREVRLKDFFNSFDLNGNGKLTMSEFCRGLKAMGHDGDEEMIADIFRAIDTTKTKTRVWDRNYHSFKRQEDEAAAQGKTIYLAPACEIFEKRDMRKWNENRAEVINEAMRTQEENMREMRTQKKEAKKAKIEVEARIKGMQDSLAERKVPNPEEDRKTDADLLAAGKELTELENTIARCTQGLQEPRFTYTQTTLKDGLLDWNEFKKCMAESNFDK